MMLALFTLTACPSDDDEDNETGTTEGNIVGKWSITSGPRITNDKMFYTFLADGTGEFSVIYRDDKTGTVEYITCAYKWTLNKGRVKLDFTHYRYWTDDTYTELIRQRAVTQEPTYYQVLFYSGDRMSLTNETDNATFMLKRKSGGSSSQQFDERLTQEIPEEYLNELANYMPIYQGNTPPSIEGTFLMSWDISVFDATNVFKVGDRTADVYYSFYNQNTRKNTISYTSQSVTSEGNIISTITGDGVILGNGNDFTVFFTSNAVKGNSTAKGVDIISGTITSDGIQDLIWGFVFTSKNDPDKNFVETGKWRVFKDGDGMSEATDWPSSARKFVRSELPEELQCPLQ